MQNIKWKEVRLGDVADYVSKKIETELLTVENYISTENLIPNIGGITEAIKLPTVKKVNEFKKRDILFSNIRTYFKKIWLADISGGASNDVLIIRSTNQEIIINEYLYYCLAQDDFFDYTVKTSKGTKMPRGDKNAIMNYLIKYPVDIENQRQIVNTFIALDDKIELNNQLSQNLEEMAQAIFKEWFVEFNFPNEDGVPYKNNGGMMEESELGMIPKGWRVEELGKVIPVADGTHDSPKKKLEGYPLVTSKHLGNNEIHFEDANLISLKDYEKVNQRSQVNQYDILISMIGTIGNLYFVQEEEINYAIKNIGLFKTSTKIEYSKFLFEYLKTSQIKHHINMRLAGSTQQYISLGELRKIPFIIPKLSTLELFNQKIEPLFSKLHLNIKENQTLIKTRDILLPKLMSGEVRV